MANESGWERETVINFSDAEPDRIHIWTCQRWVGAWVEKVAKATSSVVTRTGRPSWEADLPAALLTLRQNVVSSSPEQKAARAARMAELNRSRRSATGEKA